MQSTTIQNKGITKTIINTNGKKDENEIKWNADYDGDKANIKVDFSKNCQKNKIFLQLNNTDLSNILGIRSIPLPIHKRLENDFLNSEMDEEENPNPNPNLENPRQENPRQENPRQENPRQEESKGELEEDLKNLLNIKTLNPEPIQNKSTNYKPQPYLFRVNIQKPKLRSLSEPILSNISDFEFKQKQKPEILTVSEMLFDPFFSLSAPPITMREPTHLPSRLSSLTTDSFFLPDTILKQINERNETNPNIRRLKNRSKNRRRLIESVISNSKPSTSKKRGKKVKFLYKTPSPKTYRIHLTSNKGSKKHKKHKN